jgi:hypothetical protein
VLYTEGGASTLTPLLAGSIDIAMSNGILGGNAPYSKCAHLRMNSTTGTAAGYALSTVINQFSLIRTLPSPLDAAHWGLRPYRPDPWFYL